MLGTPWGALAMIALLTCVAYFPALQGQMLWDDDAHIPQVQMQSLSGLYRIWFDVRSTQQYYPLLFSWFWMQHQMWGDHMAGYHLVNLLLHVSAACLVYMVLQKLNIPGALLATAVFALHPVHVESVAWITEQKNTLSAVFYLAAMWTYLTFDDIRAPGSYLLALLLFAAALLSKTVTVTLPLALLILLWWKRGRKSSTTGVRDSGQLSWMRDVMPLLPFFALSLADGLLTMWVERKVIGAEGSDFDLTVAQRFLLAGRASWFYLEKLFWPSDLTFIYPRWSLDPAQWWQWLYPLTAITILVALWRLRKMTRAPLAGALFFLVTLLPVLGPLNVFFFRYSFVSDHFVYLASLGVIVPVAAGLALLAHRLSLSWGPRRLSCLLLVAILAILTWQQSRLYGRDAEHLYEVTIESNPSAAMAHINLAQLQLTNGRQQEALAHSEQAVQLRPDSTEARNNLGMALLQIGRTQDGIQQLEEALTLQPTSAIAHNNLGNALWKIGQQLQALKQFEEALRIDPGFAGAHFNYGNALVSLGRPQEGIEHLQQAIQLQPSLPDAQQKLANALAMVGRYSEAIEHYEQALRGEPDSAELQNNAGTALLAMNHPQQAIQHFERAIQLRPDYPIATYNLGLALAKAGRNAEAIDAFERALQMNPQSIEGWIQLATANARLNRTEAAAVAAQKAEELAKTRGRQDLTEQIEALLKSDVPNPPASPALPPGANEPLR